LPWVIVAAIAPRPLIYAHEFAWDKDHDPVWKRLQQIYKWYNVPDHLAASHGKGNVKGQAGPNNTHCNNIGAVHRLMIYPALKQWFGIPAPPGELPPHLKSADLQCLTPELAKENQPVYQLAHALAVKQINAVRLGLTKLVPAARQKVLRQEWSQLLGGIDTTLAPKKAVVQDTQQLAGIQVERLVLNTERDIQVPALLLIPHTKDKKPRPVVVAVAQYGHAGFLKNRSAMISALLKQGVAVCLPDVRGSGETQPGTGRGRMSTATSLSATELMLGGTVLGGQCRDLLAVLHYLRGRPEFNPDRLALWGDSFAPVNAPDRTLAVPLDADELPDQAEPMGTNLALLGALFDERICAVHARGGLGSFLSALQGPFLYLPHDAIIPGCVAAGDVCDLAAALAPRPLSLEALVDGTNRPFVLTGPQQPFAPAAKAYQGTQALRLLDAADTKDGAAAWLAEKVKG
jgi:hypothetical protein